MNTYMRGTAINLVQKFFLLDPLTQEPTPADPTTVVFTVRSSDLDETTYTYLVDGNVQRLDVGVYLCALSPQLPVGIYTYTCVGTGAVQVEAAGSFEVLEAPLPGEASPPVHTVIDGPGYPWISGQDVAGCARVDYDQEPWRFDMVAAEASAVLYQVSGRQYPGILTRTVRPCATTCGCGWSGPASYGLGPWFWGVGPGGYGLGGWLWWNETGDRFGCSPLSKVRLAGYPVGDILEVLIGGESLPEFDPDTGARNWRLDKHRYLIRMNDPGNPSQQRFWPGCQDLALDADQPGTFQIKYTWGQDAPEVGRQAAIEVANQLYLACGGEDCVLPVGATRVVRQGIEIDRGLLANWADPKKPTGLVNLDAFLMAYWQGNRGGRRSAVWTPDQQPFARAVGNDYARP